MPRTSNTKSTHSESDNHLVTWRELATTAPGRARTEGWEHLLALGRANDRGRLAALFAEGLPPDLHGAYEGALVGKLFGLREAALANLLIRIDTGWAGKTFDGPAGTGHNRMTLLGGVAMRLLAPLYTGWRLEGTELAGFDFNHRTERALVTPWIEVTAVDYTAPHHRNPGVWSFPIKRTRDEIVELVPGLFLGRALITPAHGEPLLVGYFALREPVRETAK